MGRILSRRGLPSGYSEAGRAVGYSSIAGSPRARKYSREFVGQTLGTFVLVLFDRAIVAGPLASLLGAG